MSSTQFQACDVEWGSTRISRICSFIRMDKSKYFYEVAETFHQAFQVFTPSNPVLLLMDNHDSHIPISVLKEARSRGIFLHTMPPHTSHKLQILECTVYGQLKKPIMIPAIIGWYAILEERSPFMKLEGCLAQASIRVSHLPT